MSEVQERQTGPHSLHIRIPKEVHDRVKVDAERKYTSMNQLIRALVLAEYGDSE